MNNTPRLGRPDPRSDPTIRRAKRDLTNLTRVRVHLLIFGVFLGAVCALRIGWRGHYVREAREVATRASQRRSRQIETAWKRHTYTDLSAGTEEALFQRIPWASLALSDVEQAKLRVRLSDVLHYLERPSVEEYYRLKTEGFHWSLQPRGYASNLLAKALPAADVRMYCARDPRTATRSLWAEVHTAHTEGAASPVSWLTAVCLDSVVGNTERTNTGRALLTGSVKQGFTVAVEAVDPGFVYSSEKALKAPLLFQLSFLAKANGLENAGPVYISLLWVEEDQNWALNRLLTDSWLRVKTLF